MNTNHEQDIKTGSLFKQILKQKNEMRTDSQQQITVNTPFVKQNGAKNLKNKITMSP